MNSTAEVTPIRFVGQSSRYADIAVRGTELLGLSIQYAIHPSNVGCFVLRFVAHGEGVHPKNFKHLTYRETGQFLIPATDGTSPELFKGLRLNKIALPVFSPAVHPHEVAFQAAALDVWPQIVEWVAEQVLDEGFILTMPLGEFLQESVALPATTETITSVLQFPDLKGETMKKVTLAQVQDPDEDDADEDEDEDDEDSDEDEDDSDETEELSSKKKVSKYN